MCYVNISLITDFDAGLEGQPDVEAVSVEEVIRVLHENNERVRRVIQLMVPRIVRERTCPCASALQYAVVS
jgi:5'-methylthioadenosine phosphorylase